MTDLFSELHEELHEEYCERMVNQAFARLFPRLSKPGKYCPKVAKVMSTPAPGDDACDKTSTPEDQ